MRGEPGQEMCQLFKLSFSAVVVDTGIRLIRHTKKDGAVSILETIFCEFWSAATTLKKIFDK